MELSNVGKHCEVSTCRQLDFLPFTCDNCKKIFCSEHRKYENHKCSIPKPMRDKVVPVCPLCEKPISVQPGEDIDRIIDLHITSGCKDERKEKIFTNKCSFKSCKHRELIAISCKQCKQNYCLQVIAL